MSVVFTVEGNVDPLLHAHLDRGDTLFCESGAMVAMDERLSLSGKARGGVLSSIGRKLLNDESFFQQKIEAKMGEGNVLLSPALPGAVRVLDVGIGHQYTIADGCYLANTDGVELSIGTQGIGKAIFASTGSGLKGFFTMKTGGIGQVAVSGFGALAEVEVTEDTPIIIDNGHLVAWDSTLKYELAMNLAHKGFMGTMVESITAGTIVVLKFTGRGKIIVCTRNREDFVKWMGKTLPNPDDSRK